MMIRRSTLSMPIIIGGAIAVVLGIIGLIEWRGELFVIIKGAIPVLLVLGGVLALYVGYDDHGLGLFDSPAKFGKLLRRHAAVFFSPQGRG